MYIRKLHPGGYVPITSWGLAKASQFGPRFFPYRKAFVLVSIERRPFNGTYRGWKRGLWIEHHDVANEYDTLDEAIGFAKQFHARKPDIFYAVMDKERAPKWWQRPTWEPSFFNNFETYLPPDMTLIPVARLSTVRDIPPGLRTKDSSVQEKLEGLIRDHWHTKTDEQIGQLMEPPIKTFIVTSARLNLRLLRPRGRQKVLTNPSST